MNKLNKLVSDLSNRGKEKFASHIRQVIAMEDKLKEASISQKPEALKELAKEDNSLIRSRVAGNRNTDKETLTELSGDTEIIVKLEVAGNTSTSIETLDAMALGGNEDILSCIVKNMSANKKVLDTASSKVKDIMKLELLDREELSGETLNTLSKTKNTFILYKIVLHSNTVPSTLLTISKATNDPYVLQEIGRRTDAGSETLDILFSKKDILNEEAQKDLANNPSVPIKNRRDLKKDFF